MSFEKVPNASNVVAGFSVGLPPPADVVELLPPSRRPLLLSIRQQVEDAAHVLRPLLERHEELRADRYRLNARITHLKTPHGRSGPGLDDDDTQVVDAQRSLANVDAEMVRLSELIAVRRAHSQNLAPLLAKLESWPREGRPGGTAIVAAVEIDVASTLKRNESPVAALNCIRHRLRELSADRHRIESAPFPSSYAKTRARATIEQLAERGAPDVSTLVEAGHDIGWPMTMTRLELAAVVGKSGDQIAGRAMGEEVDTMALFAWLHRDVLLKKLEAEIDAVADDVAALSPEDRERLLSEIAADQLAIERQECALVWAMQADGLPVQHRVDADPRAVLGIELMVAKVPAIMAPFGEAAREMRHVTEIIGLTPGDQS